MPKIIVANWKMFLGTRESVSLARAVLLSLRGKDVVPEVIVCPPYVALGEVHKAISRTRVHLGAQNLSAEESGAFTGEVSARMLVEAGCTYVLVGHSEARARGEDDALIGKKIALAIRSRLTPILCVGESAADREAGTSLDAVRRQVHAALAHVPVGRLLLAYEPVWAIGTEEAATPQQAVEMLAHLAGCVRELWGPSARVPLLYGGSVDSVNAYAFLREPALDGLLVGSASVKLHQFDAILAAARQVMEQLS